MVNDGEMNRREFLKVLGGITGLAAFATIPLLAGCAKQPLPEPKTAAEIEISKTQEVYNTIKSRLASNTADGRAAELAADTAVPLTFATLASSNYDSQSVLNAYNASLRKPFLIGNEEAAAATAAVLQRKSLDSVLELAEKAIGDGNVKKSSMPNYVAVNLARLAMLKGGNMDEVLKTYGIVHEDVDQSRKAHRIPLDVFDRNLTYTLASILNGDVAGTMRQREKVWKEYRISDEYGSWAAGLVLAAALGKRGINDVLQTYLEILGEIGEGRILPRGAATLTAAAMMNNSSAERVIEMYRFARHYVNQIEGAALNNAAQLVLATEGKGSGIPLDMQRQVQLRVSGGGGNNLGFLVPALSPP